MRLLLIAIVVLAATACRPDRKPDLPPSCPAQVSELSIVERIVYVPIERALTGREPIAEGPLAQCPMVAAERRAAIERANAKLKAIEAKQGTEAKP